MTITAQSDREQPPLAGFAPGGETTSPARPGRQWPLRLVRLAALGLVLAGIGYGATFLFAKHHDKASIESTLADLGRGGYEPQKAVYHVDYPAGWRDRAYENLLDALENHVNAVGAGKLQLAVVLQGSGTDLLALAKSKPRLAARIDGLRQNGVRFLVCRDTLLSRLIDPFQDLHGVARADVVTAAVAELVALQQEGYVYLRL